MRTLKTLDRAGLDLRLWCYRCQRAAVVDGIVWMRFEEKGWPLELASARRRFRCAACGATGADILIVTTKRRKRVGDGATQFVAAYFHHMRKAAKRRRRN